MSRPVFLQQLIAGNKTTWAVYAKPPSTNNVKERVLHFAAGFAGRI